MQGRQQVAADQCGRRERYRLLERPQPLQGVLAVHVLHDKLKVAFDLEEFVKLDDARVALAAGHEHVAQRLDLAVEIVQGLFAGRAVGDHHLDRNPPVAGDLPRPVNGSHPPLTNQLFDEIIGTGLREIPPPGVAFRAERRGHRPRVRQKQRSLLRIGGAWGHVLIKLNSAPCATITRSRLGPASYVVDGKGAITSRDEITLAEQHPLDPQAIDLGAVGTSQVDQVA